MAHRSPARWLAPLALVTCAIAVYGVVHSGASSDGKSSSPTVKSTERAGGSTKHHKGAGKKRRTYTVKPGDVLSAIAEKTGVSVAEIERLNPSVDAAALHPGQKLRLSQ
jgi:LysM repeat protein